MAAQAATRLALPDGAETIEVGSARVSVRGLARALDIDKNKLSRAVARVGQRDA